MILSFIKFQTSAFNYLQVVFNCKIVNYELSKLLQEVQVPQSEIPTKSERCDAIQAS